MEFKRNNGRIDINSEIENGNIVFSEEEQRGARTNKFWFNDYQYMYKDVYPLTYEDYAEMIAYHLATKLGMECAKYDLAEYNGNLGVITTNLIKDNDNEVMLSGTEIVTQVYSEYVIPVKKAVQDYMELLDQYTSHNIYEFSKLSIEKQKELKNKLIRVVNNINFNNNTITKDDSEEIDLIKIGQLYDYLNSYIDIYDQDLTEMKNGIIKANNMYDIWNVIEIYCNINNLNVDIEKFMSDLINMFIFDIITSQGDRHADNWAIIKDEKDDSIRLCPLYDNSSLCSLNREKAIKNIICYSNDLNDPSIHEKKKQKLQTLLESTINHSTSGIKMDVSDVEARRKNNILIEKYINDSSEEFIERLVSYVEEIDQELINEIFSDIENQTNVPVPEEVKQVVNVVIFNNIDMIKDVCKERGIKK